MQAIVKLMAPSATFCCSTSPEIQLMKWDYDDENTFSPFGGVRGACWTFSRFYKVEDETDNEHDSDDDD
jgi:hypothetical protein